MLTAVHPVLPLFVSLLFYKECRIKKINTMATLLQASLGQLAIIKYGISELEPL